MPFCQHCGAASVEPNQRFCQSCGKPLEAAAAAPSAETPVEPPVAESPAPVPPGGGDEPTATFPAAPAATAAPAAPGAPAPGSGEYQYVGAPYDGGSSSSGGRSLVKILAAVAVVAALAGGAFLAYTVFFDKTGAKSPEDAVTQMLEAIADQDGVEALRMVNPGETDGFGEVYEALQKRVADAGLASGDDGAVLEAVKIELTNLDVDVQEKGDNAARVYVKDGNLKITVDEGKLPEEYRELFDQVDQEILDELKDLDISEVLEEGFGSNDDVFLTTIKQDGRWYVSPVATAGEYILASEDLDPLTASEFDEVSEDNAPDPKTSKDPAGALSVLADAVSSEDLDEIFAALPADEVAALRPFGDRLQQIWDDEKNGPTDLSVKDLETDFEELDDDLGRLTIKRGTLEGTIDGDEGSATVDGTCVESTEDEEVYDEETGEYSTEPGTSRDCLPDEVVEQAGIDAIWVILRKEDGGWQIDPRATLVDYAKKAIESVDESLLRDTFQPPDFSDEEDSPF